MSNIINLNKIRKEKLRRDATKTTETNRAKFGRTKAQKQADKTSQNSNKKTVDDHIIENECDTDGNKE